MSISHQDRANPYLDGLFAPVREEVAATHLPVTGELPRDLHGLYARNGPNPDAPPQGMHHWFDGDGMVHGIWFENGCARYANRFVMGEHLRAARAGLETPPGIFEPACGGGRDNRVYRDTANTDLVFHDGKILALWYISGVPVAIDPDTLSTIRDETFSAALPRGVSAHSKTDPRTGEFVFFDYALYEPWMSYGVISPDGRLLRHRTVELPGPRLPHDMGLTETYVVLHDLPVVFSREAIRQRRWSVHFANQPTRFGVARRDGAGPVRWFEVEPCYVYHVVNCWEDGEEVVMTACRMVDNGMPPDPRRFGPYAPMVSVLALHAHLTEWRFDLRTGAVRERRLDDRIAEFPVVDPRGVGVATRWAYLVSMAPGPLQRFEGLLKYDLTTGAAERHGFAPGWYGSEPAFAPRIGARGEDDGYVITFVTEEASGRSEALVIDARNFTAPPLARVRLPQRVPAGFHGVWVPGEALSSWSGAAV
jgi:carotenoid cleavage dioxygenase